MAHLELRLHRPCKDFSARSDDEAQGSRITNTAGQAHGLATVMNLGPAEVGSPEEDSEIVEPMRLGNARRACLSTSAGDGGPLLGRPP